MPVPKGYLTVDKNMPVRHWLLYCRLTFTQSVVLHSPHTQRHSLQQAAWPPLQLCFFSHCCASSSPPPEVTMNRPILNTTPSIGICYTDQLLQLSFFFYGEGGYTTGPYGCTGTLGNKGVARAVAGEVGCNQVDKQV